mmetsp:Transcript_72799/g.160954  ORF Transcript_72799/g.160954 Transcript_72799/m.160954 type:complete len:223 (-) Transcript_72799:194-862(-)
MPDVQDAVSDHRQGGGCPAERTIKVPILLELRAQPVRLRECCAKGLLRVVLEVWILNEAAWQGLLHEVRNVVPVRAVPIKDAIDAGAIHTEDAEVVLVWALGLQALFASVADPEVGQRILTALGRSLVHEALLLCIARDALERHPPLCLREEVDDVPSSTSGYGATRLRLGATRHLLRLGTGEPAPAGIMAGIHDIVCILGVGGLSDARAHAPCCRGRAISL